MNTNTLSARVLLVGLVLMPISVFSADLIQQRSDFLTAEKLISQHKDDAFLEASSKLTDYPLYPMLQYLWLKENLPLTDKIKNFLITYKDSRYAELLRSKWLAYLAQQQRWPEFLQNYQAGDDVVLECQYNWANYKAGNTQAALDVAKKLWLAGESQPAECEPLLAAFASSPLMSSDLIWQRFELALQAGNPSLAEYLRKYLLEAEQPIANLWLTVHKHPGLIENNQDWQHTNPLVGRLFAHGVERMAKNDLDRAAFNWDKDKQSFTIDPTLQQRIERKLGLSMAFKRNLNAYDRLTKVINPDEEVRESRIRAALLEQNWRHVNDALAGLTAEEKQTPHWQYWQARASAQLGDVVQSQSIYDKLAQDRSFYGFLAADTLNKAYQIPDRPVPVLGNELQTLEQQPDFVVAYELVQLGKNLEAQKQWRYATKKLNKPQLMIAAKLAQKWLLPQTAIFTLAKADYWDDMELRFPINYFGQVETNAAKNNLDPSLVLGLIRQESVFDKDVQSPVGAKGLMQIMPKTGQQIAVDLNEIWRSDNSLLDPDVNVRYGTFYFKQLLQKFNGHVPLATAAYNAGPHNVLKWLPAINNMPADIWIETIPFKETRKYVSSVLTYTMVYQQRLHREGLRVKNLLPDVGSG